MKELHAIPSDKANTSTNDNDMKNKNIATPIIQISAMAIADSSIERRSAVVSFAYSNLSSASSLSRAQRVSAVCFVSISQGGGVKKSEG